MSVLIASRKDRPTGSRVVIEEGWWNEDARPSYDLRLVCDTHGTVESAPRREDRQTGRVCSIAEARRMLKRPWEWCLGCQLARAERLAGERP